MYDEIAIVVGKDVARESGATSFDDVEIQSLGVTNLEEKRDGDDEFLKENDKQSTSSAPMESRKIRKSIRDDDLELQNISTQMAEVAMALQKISKSKLDAELLYQEVMKTEGFQEDFLGSAFDHLVERENLAISSEEQQIEKDLAWKIQGEQLNEVMFLSLFFVSPFLAKENKQLRIMSL